jgi:sugar/nucleoside kinase (ribokinase family)
VLDILARVDDAVLQRLGAEPGGCVPVDAEEMARLLALPEVAAGMARVPGGSAANVMKGLAGLGQGSLKVAFVGMVGTDEVGAEYQASIAAKGVRPLLLEAGSGAPTGTCLCLVTPDGQRTMRTALCAALELSTPQQLPPPLAPSPPSGGADASNLGNGSSSSSSGPQAGSTSASAGSPALLHCEGYSLYRPKVAAAAMRAARAAGARVSLDLASFEVVKNCWAQLDSLLQVRCAAADTDALLLHWHCCR